MLSCYTCSVRLMATPVYDLYHKIIVVYVYNIVAGLCIVTSFPFTRHCDITSLYVSLLLLCIIQKLIYSVVAMNFLLSIAIELE